MKKRMVFRWLMAAGAVVLSLFIVLVIHIYMVTRVKNDDKRIRQLARIDFKQNITAIEGQALKNKLLSMDGVDAAYYNAEEDVLVYSFNPTLQNADKIFLSLVEQENKYLAVRFRVPKDQLASGCPVIDKSSFSYQLGSFVQNVLNN